MRHNQSINLNRKHILKPRYKTFNQVLMYNYNPHKHYSKGIQLNHSHFN